MSVISEDQRLKSQFRIKRSHTRTALENLRIAQTFHRSFRAAGTPDLYDRRDVCRYIACAAAFAKVMANLSHC